MYPLVPKEDLNSSTILTYEHNSLKAINCSPQNIIKNYPSNFKINK